MAIDEHPGRLLDNVLGWDRKAVAAGREDGIIPAMVTISYTLAPDRDQRRSRSASMSASGSAGPAIAVKPGAIQAGDGLE